MLPTMAWNWPEGFQHVWFLVSAGTNESLYKFWPVLAEIPNLAVRGISMEPLLENIYWPYKQPDWVIVGGESGSKHRPMSLDWARHIRDECVYNKIPFFYKGLVGNSHAQRTSCWMEKIYHEFPR